jgi:hypothetical protein
MALIILLISYGADVEQAFKLSKEEKSGFKMT